MEVDKIRYIFGSFARKKDKRKSLDQSSISAGNSPLHLNNERPISRNLVIPPRTSAYEDPKGKGKIKEWDCKLCGKELVEPRLLACLHSFCTICQQDLPQEGQLEVWTDPDIGSIQLEPTDSREGSGAGSAGSGYESDLRNSGSDGSWDPKPKKFGIFTRKYGVVAETSQSKEISLEVAKSSEKISSSQVPISGKNIQVILCPTCGDETPLPLGGISALPLNYVLLRKMAAAQEDRLNVLCDLCNSDTKAESRCNQCLVSICSSCGEAHGRQKATAKHLLQPLEPPPVSFCSQHPRAELSVYCATCQQVICRECCVIAHCGHALGGAGRAASAAARRLRDAASRAAYLPEHTACATRELHANAFEQDSKAARVEAEILTWAEQYRRAVEAHGRALARAAARARRAHRARVEHAHRDLAERAERAREAVGFAEDLLSQGREGELLSLSGPVVCRLEQLTETPVGQVPKLELRFAPRAPSAPDSTLVGRLLTHPPCPDASVLDTGGFQDLIVNSQHETTLELRDNNGDRIWCGGEQVSGYFRRQDSSARPTAAGVHDRGDGTYRLTFTAPAPGAYLLAVTLNNMPLKGSPFSCHARGGRAHTGVFHCCAFCSSGGKRDATCACGATMPGGYKGCGHGHAGWPGTRHWSCCGNTQRDAPCNCNTQRVTSRLYQFSL